MKIFGRDKFLDTRIATIETSLMELEKKNDDIIYNEIFEVTQRMGFVIDEIKLREQIEFMMKLDNIEKTELIDCAVKMRIEKLSNELAEKKADLIVEEKIGKLFGRFRQAVDEVGICAIKDFEGE